MHVTDLGEHRCGNLAAPVDRQNRPIVVIANQTTTYPGVNFDDVLGVAVGRVNLSTPLCRPFRRWPPQRRSKRPTTSGSSERPAD